MYASSFSQRRATAVGTVFCLFILSNSALAIAQVPHGQPMVRAMDLPSVPPIVKASNFGSPEETGFAVEHSTSNVEMTADHTWQAEPTTDFLSEVQTSNERNRVWFGAVDVSFLRPNVNLPQSSVFVDDGLGGGITSATNGAELEDFYTASRLTLGTQKGKNTLVIRYWNLDINETDYFDSPNLSNPSTSAGVGQDHIGLDFTTIDIEFHKAMACKCMDSMISLGTRYVEFDSFALATASDLLQGEAASITGFNQQNYKGMGLVGGWNGEIPLRDSGWSFVLGGRASAIFGTHYQRTVRSGVLGSQYAYSAAATRNSSGTNRTDTLGAGAQASANVVPTDDPTLWIFEGQLNLKYSRQFANAMGFFSFGVEYQYWDLPEATTDAPISINRPLRELDPVSNGLGLTGFNVSTGLTY